MSGSLNGNELPKAFGSSNSNNSNKNPKRNKTDGINSEKLFTKTFEFHRDDGWILPPASHIFSVPPWKVKHLQTLKNGLNFQKSRLNDYPIEDWSAHTSRRNPTGDVRWKLRTTINPEFLTQAWTKFYECAYNFPIVPEHALARNEFNSLHLCEAPGAFIAALNHFLKLRHHDLKWRWLATTLNPYHEDNCVSDMICDDRFILHTLPQWDFGLDYTGNLMDWKNSKNLIERAKRMGDINLVTADGSIDCMLRPDEQEKIVAPLHFCEVITALLALSKGGAFLMKLFTIFEHSTINLVYLLVASFERVSIFKPATSKEGNSEVYAVCTGYKGRHLVQDYVDSIVFFYGGSDFVSKALFPLECLPESFLDQIQACAFYFYDKQCRVINENIFTYENPNPKKDSSMKAYRFAIAHVFMERYKLAAINKDDEILKIPTQEDSYVHLNPRSHHGTYTERLHLVQLTQQEKVVKLNEELKSLKATYDLSNSDGSTRLDCTKLDAVPLSYVHGKSIEKIRSSKFVLSWILKFYNRLIEECPDKMSSKQAESAFKELFTIVFPSQAKDKKYDEWEKGILKIFRDKLIMLRVGDNLILRNFRCLTQFSSGVLYLIAQTSFHELEFANNSTVMLVKFKNKDEVIRVLDSIISEVGKTTSKRGGGGTDNRAVLGVLPIHSLGLGVFYTCLLKFNSNFLYARCRDIIDHLFRLHMSSFTMFAP